MKKILIGVVLVIVVLVVFLNIGGREKVNTNKEDVVYQNTISISRSYVVLRLKTDNILEEASKYSDYKTWNNEMTELIKNWENLETEASNLEEQARIFSEDKLGFKLVNEAWAFTKDEISNVFDKAPAGRKIRTLAKYLGVDAKRAYKILQNDQEFVKADAWNEAGDTFKKLEVSAIVIKDGCKVAGFVGAAVLTGGVATAAEGTIMIVTGTDLMLEVGEDTATIALGDKHKAVKAISGIRSYTDPAASILSLTDIPKNVAKGAALLDKIGVVLVQVDQIRSIVQDGKLLGINIRPDSKVEIAAIKESEIEEWVDENSVDDDFSEDLDDWLDGFDDLGDWMDDFDTESEEAGDELAVEDEKEEEAVADEDNEEEIVKNNSINKVYTKDGKVSVWIASPHGVLSSGQTQMWEVKIDGYRYYGTDDTYVGENRGYECYWDYYTEYAPGVKPWMNMRGCRNTHGVPGRDIFVGEPSGELKVVVRVEFLEQDYGTDEWGNEVQKGKKVVEIVTLEENYEITPYFHH